MLVVTVPELQPEACHRHVLLADRRRDGRDLLTANPHPETDQSAVVVPGVRALGCWPDSRRYQYSERL